MNKDDELVLPREWFLNTFKDAMDEAITFHGLEYAAVAWTAYRLLERQFPHGTVYIPRDENDR